MTKKKKILLTGDKWGDRQGTTVEPDVLVSGENAWFRPEGSVGGRMICLPGCREPKAGWEGVEVPYLIGEKVRLTGRNFPNRLQNTVAPVLRYIRWKGEWVPNVDPEDDGGWFILNDGFYDGSAAPVTENEGRVIETGEHPNFVQVSVKVPTFSSEYDKSYSAYRDDEYSPWELLSTEIKDATDIKGLRKVLEEIERRIG